jgi:hypothetical protein
VRTVSAGPGFEIPISPCPSSPPHPKLRVISRNSTPEKRFALQTLTRNGKVAALKIRHAGILLALDQSDAGPKLKDAEGAKAFGVCDRSVKKHGSWLNMAECELGVLARECLNDWIGDQDALRHRVAAWEKDRNNRCKTIDWQFTTADARIKLRRLYPQFRVS